MKRTRKLLYSIEGSALLLAMNLHGAESTNTTGNSEKVNSEKPNVIFILCDDLGYGDIGCNGQKKLKTPNIDKIASEGIRFTDFYSGSTVCAPSRCVLMTGQHTGHTTIRGNNACGKRPDGTSPSALEKDKYNMAKMFKSAGYATGVFGKWGLGNVDNDGNALKQGFDRFVGYYDQHHAHTYYPKYLWNDNKKMELDGNTYSHDLIWNEGMKFIKKNAEEKKPFFCYMAVTIPHAAMAAPPELMEKWRKVYPEFNNVIGHYKGYGMGKDAEIVNPIAGFAAMMENLDNQIGGLLTELKKLGIDNNTITIFTSDNGPHKEGGHNPEFWDSNGPLRGIKRNLTDGGIRVPMLIRWPAKIAPGTESDHVSAFWDFLPTFADIVNVKIPEKAEIDGISILPVLTGDQKDQKEHKVLYWEFNERGPKQAIRMGKWKFIRYRNNTTGEHKLCLYDLDKDIGEEHNLVTEFPEVVSECKKLMDAEHDESSYFPINKDVPKKSKTKKIKKPKTKKTEESK